MNDPIERLLAEHRAIMGRVDDLRTAVAELARRGDAALPDAMPALEAAGRMMATDLPAHARREDEALFPALEAALGEGATPAAVMREEHRAIHDRADLFRRTLHELDDVEHPAIAALGRTLRDLAAQGGGAEALRRAAEAVIELLDAHFAKEEQILFPMAREVLAPDELARVAESMEALGAGR